MELTELIKRANISLKIREYDQAIYLLDKALKIDPQNTHIYLLKGNIYNQQGIMGKASDMYKNVIKINSQSIEAYNNLGVIQKKLGNYNEAVKMFKNALQYAPDREDIHYNLGNLYKINGNFLEAIDEFKKCLNINPNYNLVYNNLGITYEKLKRYGDAINIYQQGLQKDPNNAKIHYNIGIVYEKLGKNKEATAAYKKSVYFNPRWIDALNNLGVSFEKAGKLDEAKEQYIKILDIDPDSIKARNNLGIVYEKLNEYENAIHEYKTALDKNPHYTRAINNLGRVYLLSEKYGEAIGEYEKIIKLNPNNTEGYFNLGKIYKSMERYEDSISQFNKVLKLDSNHLGATKELGDVYKTMGAVNKALNQYKRASQINPDDDYSNFELGSLTRQEGDLKTAEYQFRKILKKNPDNIDVRLQLGETLLENGQFDQAENEIKSIITNQPGNKNAHYNLGKIYKKKGDLQKAMGAFENLIGMDVVKEKHDGEEDIGFLLKSLEKYEEALVEHEKNFQKEREINLNKLKTVNIDDFIEEADAISDDLITLEKEGRQVELDDYMNAFQYEQGDDDIPIIDIGDEEPEFALQEAEEVIDLAEEESEEEIFEEEKLDLESADPNSFFRLLEGQELYKRNEKNQPVSRSNFDNNAMNPSGNQGNRTQSEPYPSAKPEYPLSDKNMPLPDNTIPAKPDYASQNFSDELKKDLELKKNNGFEAVNNADSQSAATADLPQETNSKPNNENYAADGMSNFNEAAFPEPIMDKLDQSLHELAKMKTSLQEDFKTEVQDVKQKLMELNDALKKNESSYHSLADDSEKKSWLDKLLENKAANNNIAETDNKNLEELEYLELDEYSDQEAEQLELEELKNELFGKEADSDTVQADVPSGCEPIDQFNQFGNIEDQLGDTIQEDADVEKYSEPDILPDDKLLEQSRLFKENKIEKNETEQRSIGENNAENVNLEKNIGISVESEANENVNYENIIQDGELEEIHIDNDLLEENNLEDDKMEDNKLSSMDNEIKVIETDEILTPLEEDEVLAENEPNISDKGNKQPQTAEIEFDNTNLTSEFINAVDDIENLQAVSDQSISNSDKKGGGKSLHPEPDHDDHPESDHDDHPELDHTEMNKKLLIGDMKKEDIHGLLNYLHNLTSVLAKSGNTNRSKKMLGKVQHLIGKLNEI